MGRTVTASSTSDASLRTSPVPAPSYTGSVKERRRSVLHVDLDPFFVSVERSLDPSLRDRPVVIGGDGQGMGFVAAVSDEARQAGVRPGLPLAQAHLLCPDAAFRRGDLDAYGHCSEEVTAVLLAASRRVERPSADEAFVDLTAEDPGDPPPVRAAETIRDELQRRLGLDASLGLASSRLAARIASGWAKPRGLLVVLPGYEHSFVAGKPVAVLGLPPHLEAALGRAGLATLGQVGDAPEADLVAAVGAAAAARVRAAARGEQEPPIAVAAPPVSLQDEATIRDRRSDRVALEESVGRPRPAGGSPTEAVPPRGGGDRGRGAPRGRHAAPGRRLQPPARRRGRPRRHRPLARRPSPRPGRRRPRAARPAVAARAPDLAGAAVSGLAPPEARAIAPPAVGRLRGC